MSKKTSFHLVKLTVFALSATGIFTVTIAIFVIFWVVVLVLDVKVRDSRGHRRIGDALKSRVFVSRGLELK